MSSKGTLARLRRFSTWAFAGVAAAGLAAALTFSGRASAQTAQSRIAFERRGSIWTMNADGTGQTELSNTDAFIGHEPSLSADGQKIVFTCGGESTNICATDAAGGNVTMLTATGDNRNPVFSPDGTKIAFTSRRDGSAGVYVMDADGSNVVQLVTGDAGGEDEEYPTWSPDGQRVAFVKNNSEIYTAKADGSGDVQLVLGGAGFKVNLAYSPDGSHIAFDNVNDVYVVSAAGGAAVRLTTTGTQSFDPAWSPDGQRIAFHRINVVRDQDGNHLYTERGLYVMQANGLGLANLNCPDGYGPSWANVTATPTPTPTPEATPTPEPTPTPTPEPTPTPTPTPGPTPSERVANLINLVNSFNLHHGTANSLLVKLNHAQGALGAGDAAAACNDLASFINEVRAQSGKKLTAAQASQLTNEATLIRAAIGCR